MVTTDHAYVPVLTQLRMVAANTGAKIRVAHVPVTAAGTQEVVDAIMAETSGKTKFVVVDHVASCSGMVFPVEPDRCPVPAAGDWRGDRRGARARAAAG